MSFALKMRLLVLACLTAGVLQSGCRAEPTRPEAPTDRTQDGRISGRIRPAVGVRILAKLKGTDGSKPENVKGEINLPIGGDFTIDRLPAGTYDLLFSVYGDAFGKFTASRWSEIDVEAGKTTSGINYRLTPADQNFMIDEVIVEFTATNEEARASIAALGCRIKDQPAAFKERTFCLVDIPDDKTVDQMVKAFKARPGVVAADPNYCDFHPAAVGAPGR